MSIKEKPLIDAVSRLGPLPDFLFSNMVFAGFFASLMSAVFGAVFTVFQVAGRGFVDTLELYDAARIGAYITLALTAVILISISITAPRDPDERKVRYQFVTGGFLGIAFLAVLDFFTIETMRRLLENAGPIV